MQHVVSVGNLNINRFSLTKLKPNSLNVTFIGHGLTTGNLRAWPMPLLQAGHLNTRMGHLISSLDLSFPGITKSPFPQLFLV